MNSYRRCRLIIPIVIMMVISVMTIIISTREVSDVHRTGKHLRGGLLVGFYRSRRRRLLPALQPERQPGRHVLPGCHTAAARPRQQLRQLGSADAVGRSHPGGSCRHMGAAGGPHCHSKGIFLLLKNISYVPGFSVMYIGQVDAFVSCCLHKTANGCLGRGSAGQSLKRKLYLKFCMIRRHQVLSHEDCLIYTDRVLYHRGRSSRLRCRPLI